MKITANRAIPACNRHQKIIVNAAMSMSTSTFQCPLDVLAHQCAGVLDAAPQGGLHGRAARIVLGPKRKRVAQRDAGGIRLGIADVCQGQLDHGSQFRVILSRACWLRRTRT